MLIMTSMKKKKILIDLLAINTKVYVYHLNECLNHNNDEFE